MGEFNFKKYLKEGKLLKENSDDYIIDQISRYLVKQISDDMLDTEFEDKEDINKYFDGIIEGINRLRAEKLAFMDTDPDFDNLEESKLNKALKKSSNKLAEDKSLKVNEVLKQQLTRGKEYSVLEPGMNEYLDNLEFIGYDSNEREYVFIDSTNIAPGSNEVFFMKVPASDIESDVQEMFEEKKS